MTLPVFLRPAPVILVGEGEAAAAKARLLARMGMSIVAEEADARLAVVAIDDDARAAAAVDRLRARGILVNAVDRSDLCDFTLPAIVDRSPVLVAVGTGGVSAGLAAALRQRLEALLPAGLGALADAFGAARTGLRARFPDPGERRRAIAAMLAPGAALDPLADHAAPDPVAAAEAPGAARLERMVAGPGPDSLTLRQARLLANADRVFHAPGVAAAVLDRARADAPRIAADAAPADPGAGLSLWVEGR